MKIAVNDLIKEIGRFIFFLLLMSEWTYFLLLLAVSR